ncbi:hypothetical protein BN873_p10031 [Candidatus Competibacter denitrificans Run_A_D11]|uniref:Uncharacterized protein n=1 Tax=Candidatus Competibacter denitrificans Run_A_D11 TaxID=1400863 RepID=W6MA61_9GAMM|nr:hypothetical protein BN873_p10031 [Candidatus Competibacter denitrificans Run_A_D11]
MGGKNAVLSASAGSGVNPKIAARTASVQRGWPWSVTGSGPLQARGR